jgi:hypothetical protein
VSGHVLGDRFLVELAAGLLQALCEPLGSRKMTSGKEIAVFIPEV